MIDSKSDRTWYSKVIDRLPGRRRLEATAHLASWAAVMTTLLLIGWGASEAHPVTNAMFALAGPELWALASPLLVTSIYRVGVAVGEHCDVSERGQALAFVPVTGVLGLDAARNVWILSQVGLPQSFVWGEFTAVGVGIAVGALACYYRVGRSVVGRARQADRRAVVKAAGAAGIIVLASVAPFAGVAPVGTADAAGTPTLVDGFESGTLSDWTEVPPGVSASTAQPAVGDFSFAYDPAGGFGRASRPISDGVTNSISFRLRVNGTADPGWVNINGDEYTVAQIRIQEGNITDSNGGVIASNIPAGEYMTVQISNIDYEEGTYDLTITDTEGTVITSISEKTFDRVEAGDIDEIRLTLRGNSAVYLDQIITNGWTEEPDTKSIDVRVFDQTEENLFSDPRSITWESKTDTTTDYFNSYNRTTSKLQPETTYTRTLRSESGAVYQINYGVRAEVLPATVTLLPGVAYRGEVVEEGVSLTNVQVNETTITNEPPDYDPPDYEYTPPEYETPTPYEFDTPTPVDTSTPVDVETPDENLTGTPEWQRTGRLGENATNASVVNMNTTDPVEEFNYTIRDENGTVLYNGSKTFEEPTSWAEFVIPNSELQSSDPTNNSSRELGDPTALPEDSELDYSGEYSNGTSFNGTADVSFSSPDLGGGGGGFGPIGGGGSSGGGGSPLVGATLIGGVGLAAYWRFGNGQIGELASSAASSAASSLAGRLGP